MGAYYNEIDPFAAAWLRELIKAGHIAPGEVDERSIEDVTPADLTGFAQCHFFAGIGAWSYALRCAGWPDDRPVWTGSCPCQPFSAAGQGAGFADERHLWPALYHLIAQCHPDIIFGEQVASQHGLAWLDLVQADLEGAGYACGAVDTCAAGFGAPHIRQRLYWVGDRGRAGLSVRECPFPAGEGWGEERGAAEQSGGASCGLEHYGGGRRKRGQPSAPGNIHDRAAPQRQKSQHGAGRAGAHRLFGDRPGPTNGYWRDADWLRCKDDKWRPVRSGTFPLAHGAPSRVGRLRGYGNAIVAAQAEAFVRAYMVEAPQ